MDKIINTFVDFVIEQKKFQFLVSEVTFDEQLYTDNILKLGANDIYINDFQTISEHILLKYKEKFNFKLSEDFNRNVIFIKSIKEGFNENGYVHDYHILEKELWKIIIKESNSKFKCSFNDYLKEDKPEGIYDFINAYSELLSELNLTDNEIFENVIILTEITKSDATYNVPLTNILNGIKNKCTTDYENGIKLLNKSLTLKENNDNVISAIVSGLYENKRNEFYETVLIQIIEDETKLTPILFGLSNVSEISVSDCDLFVKIVSDYDNNNTSIISRLSIVFAILKSNNIHHHNFCFKKLEFAIENENTAYNILHNLCFLKNYNQEKTNIIVKLVNQDYFTIEKYIKPISQIFWYLKEFKSFKKVVLSIISKKPYEKFINFFDSYFHSANVVELETFLIELLIDNSANKRQAGIELFEELSFHKSYHFSFNILELPPLSQYKLWVSLTQDFQEPKKRLTALLPLIDSNSELVKESFICKMEVISEDYGGHITDVLEDNLDISVSNYSNIIDRVRKYIEEFYSKNIDIKKELFELNPNYTHYKYIKKYNELFYKKMNRTVEKGAKENSILSILGANTIHLSKGGGWKTGSKNEVSQLGRFGSSFTMPRSYFINPNEFELSKGFEMRQDWTDDEFLDIKIFLENE